MSSIRIRVGAVLDPGATRVFDPLVAAAQRARRAIAAEGKASAAEYAGAYRDAPAKLKKAFDDGAKAAEDADKRSAASGKRASEERIASAEREASSVKRLLARQEAERRRVISSAGRTFGGAVRAGVGIAGEVARGAGVDFSVQGLTSRNVATQKTATDITNSAYVEGASGSVGVRKDPEAVIKAAKQAADAAAISEETALAGLQKFVGKSTDLQTGVEILTKMAVQAKATGSNLEEVLDAAGDIAVKLDDGADKGKILAGLMATVAKQGQLGASELRTMAPFIGRIVSSANQFAGGTEKAVQELGAVFQITKKMQGQTVGSAATATNRFVEALSSKSGLKSLYGPGKLKQTDVFDEHGKTRSLSEIIPKLMDITKGGDPRLVAKLLPNVNAAKVLKAFAQPYAEGEKQGKGGGAKAVASLFGEYGGAMSQNQIQESLARALGTTESKAQLFQNRLQAIADDNLPRVIESMEKLAPAAAGAAEGFAKFVGWAAANPWAAVEVAVAGSLTKAAIGPALEKGLAKALGTTAGLTIGTATLAIASAVLIYKQVQSEKKGGAESVFEDVGKAYTDIDKARKEKKSGAISPELRDRLEKERETLASDLALGARGDLTTRRLQALNPFSDTTLADVGKQEGAQDQGFRADAAARMKEIDALLGKSAGDHTKAAGELSAAAKALKAAADGFKPVGGFGPGATTGPAPVR